MVKEGNYYSFQGNFPCLDYNSFDEVQTHDQEKMMKSHIIGSTDQYQQPNFNYSLNNLSFADVMQFADFGPKLALNDHHHDGSLMVEDKGAGGGDGDHEITRPGEENYTSAQLRFLGENLEKRPMAAEANNKSKRKRPRSTIKTSEEVESQRMTHIAVERNRRKQMNEHLHVLRTLMPSSYVQRGDQASIIGGAIEFVRELEQLLQCLESQKRRRLYGDGHRPVGDPSSMVLQAQSQLPIPYDQQVEYKSGLREETAESKSCLADVEVKLLGFDALIKILSRRKPGQLINTISALEDMQLNILHTNITTIEQTVLYSFNVKIGGEARYTAEDMANSVQQIFSFIHASSSI